MTAALIGSALADYALWLSARRRARVSQESWPGHRMPHHPLRRPRLYRYQVADGPPRGRLGAVGLNRYPGQVIGAYCVVGQFAYCVKWGSAS